MQVKADSHLSQQKTYMYQSSSAVYKNHNTLSMAVSKSGHTDTSIAGTSKEIPLNKSLDLSEIKQLSPGSCLQLLTKSLSHLSFRVYTLFSYTLSHLRFQRIRYQIQWLHNFSSVTMHAFIFQINYC